MNSYVARGLAVLFVAGNLAGCTLMSGEPLDDGAYQAGFGPGCHTAQQRQGSYNDYRDRDEARYASDRSYRAGWNAGYHSCMRQSADPHGSSQTGLGGPSH
jgi:hypothetical protein